MTDLPSPGLGHNNPPSAIETLRAALVEDNAALTLRTADLEAATLRLPETIDDDEMAGRFGDFKVQLKGQIKALDGARIATKEPHLGACRAVDSFFQTEITRLEKSFDIIQARHTAYLTAKENRERAEALRLAEEAYTRSMEERARAQAALKTDVDLQQVETHLDHAREFEAVASAYQETAQARPADLSRIRGAGSVSSLRSYTDFVITDYQKIPLKMLQPYIGRPAIELAIRALIRANKIQAGDPCLKGVTFIERKEAQSR